MSGTIPTPLQTASHPPCEELPDKDQVSRALEQHQVLVTRVQQVGPGVKIGIDFPCKDHPTKALVRISYTTDPEKIGIDNVLQNSHGFGVPAQPHKD